MLTRIIKIASQPGDLVMDPFTGSGTTAVVAHALGRNFTGFEIDEKYAEIAKNRMLNCGFIPGSADSSMHPGYRNSAVA